MKKITKMLFVALMAMASTTAFAQDKLTAEEVTLAAGETTTITFKLTSTNPNGYCAILIDKVTVADGLTLSNVKPCEAGWNDGGSGLTCDYTTNISVAPMSGTSVSVVGTDVPVFTVDVTAASGLTDGVYSISFDDILLTDNITYEDIVAPAFDLAVTVGEATGINEVSAQNENAPIYSISGARMNGNLQKGIYVQNGRKFIVK